MSPDLPPPEDPSPGTQVRSALPPGGAATASGCGPGAFPGPGWALFLYVLLAIALTWPLAIHLGDRLPAGDNDLWQNYWNFWWWRTATVEHLESPYSTDLLYQPGEVSLAFHTHSEASILQSFPVLLLAGVPAALNLSTLLGFLLAAWGGYFLAVEVTGNRGAAFLAGLVAAYFPQHFEQSLEHINLASYQAMPFFLAFLLRLIRRGGVGNMVLTGAAFAANCLYSWHNGLLILPTAIILFAVETRRGPRPAWRVITDAAAAAGVCTLLVLPFLWPLVRDILSGESYYLKPPVKKGIDPVFLLLPPARHPLWGGAVAGLYERWKPYASVGFTGYLGASSVAISVAGWIAARRPRPRDGGSAASPRGPWILWTCLFLLPAVLALGDTLVVTGRDTGLPMPFGIIEGAPVLKTLRVANRFLVPAMLALSVLVALGARSLLERAPRRSGLLLAGLCALVAVDFLWVPYPLREIPRPAWAEAVARCAPGLLLDIPGSYQARESEDMYYQTIHGRPLVGGYTSCLPPFVKERVARYPFLQLVFEGRPSPEIVAHARDRAQLEADVRAVLDDLPVAVVVLHLEREKERLERLRAEHRRGHLSHLYNPEKGLPASTMEAIDRVLRDLWGPPCYEDASARVYARPAAR